MSTEDPNKPYSDIDLGTPGGRGAEEYEVLSIDELEQAILTGGPVSTAHLKAFVLTEGGSPVLGSIPRVGEAQKAKSWVVSNPPYQREYLQGSDDISAYIQVRARVSQDLSASIEVLQIIQSATLDLGASVQGLYSSDLGSVIKGYTSGTGNITADITRIGYYEHLQALVKSLSRGEDDLKTQIRPIASGDADLGGFVQPFSHEGLSASLITQRIKDLRGLVYVHQLPATEDISALIKVLNSGTLDLAVEPLKAVVSTHTSDKKPNVGKYPSVFNRSQYLLGTGAGLSFLTIQPIFGTFPDLHAYLNAVGFSFENLQGILKAAQRSTAELPTQASSVLPFIDSRKLNVKLQPLLNLLTDLTSAGGYAPLRSTITPKHSVSTSTADDAGFSSIASGYTFYVGSPLGLTVITPQPDTEFVTTYYQNSARLPDLRAGMTGWHSRDLGAYIKDYPYRHLGASLVAFDASRMSALPATLRPNTLADLSASVQVSGGTSDISAGVSAGGQVADLTSHISATFDLAQFKSFPVSTIPYANLYATINHTLCNFDSGFSNLGGYLKSIKRNFSEEGSDLSAYLNSRRIKSNISASITARKRLRLSTTYIDFTIGTRDNSFIRSSITPVIPTYRELSADIQGLSHEFDLGAELAPQRPRFPGSAPTFSELVYNTKTDELKEIILSFKTRVKSYVYDDVVKSVYSLDGDSWSINLKYLDEQDEFFDIGPNARSLVLNSLNGYNSFDEAIRAALVILCERRQSDFGASLSPAGYIRDFSASIGIYTLDQVSDLDGKVVAVYNSPDISASVNTGNISSMVNSLNATLYPEASSTGDLPSSITGTHSGDLSASVIIP